MFLVGNSPSHGSALANSSTQENPRSSVASRSMNLVKSMNRQIVCFWSSGNLSESSLTKGIVDLPNLSCDVASYHCGQALCVKDRGLGPAHILRLKAKVTHLFFASRRRGTVSLWHATQGAAKTGRREGNSFFKVPATGLALLAIPFEVFVEFFGVFGPASGRTAQRLGRRFD